MAMERIPKHLKYLGFLGATVLLYPIASDASMRRYLIKQDCSKRTIILTGADSNAGLAICQQLIKQNARIIMACKDMDQCLANRRHLVVKTKHRQMACRHLDLEDLNSINKFITEVTKTEPHIDVLINAAEIQGSKKKEMTKYGVEKTFWYNFVAPFLLTFRLMDKLKESSSITRDSRIVNVIGNPKKNWNVDLDDINFEKRTYKPDEAYKQSKLALAYFTVLLDRLSKEEQKGIHVYGASTVVSPHRMIDPLYRPIGVIEYFTQAADAYINYNPIPYTGPIVKCAVDLSLGEPQNVGKLYGYFLYGFNWPKVACNDRKAKLVWNYAANILLNIPDYEKKGSSKATMETDESVNKKTTTDIKTSTTDNTTRGETEYENKIDAGESSSNKSNSK